MNKSKIYKCKCEIAYSTLGDQLLRVELCYDHSQGKSVNLALRLLAARLESVIEKDSDEGKLAKNEARVIEERMTTERIMTLIKSGDSIYTIPTYDPRL